jgi:TAT (twin-arginine translocation) pathway signal sequence
MYSRRNFLKTSATAAAATLLLIYAVRIHSDHRPWC